MKLKRFLALVVSLAMVLSIVPAFSLTASAAGTTDTITALGAEVVWSCPDGSFDDTAIATAWPGWSATIGAGTDANIKTYSVGNTLQIYKTNANNNDISATITSPGYGAGADLIVLEWVHKTQIAPGGSGDLYFNYVYKDIDGVEIFNANMDKNDTSVDDSSPFGYPAEGTKMAFAAYNNTDGTHTVDCYVAGEKVHTLVKDGEINGFGSISVGWGPWSSDWNHMGFANLAIGAVMPATAKDITATYTVNGATVKTQAKTIDTSETDSASFAEVYAVYNADVYYAAATTLTDSASVEMTKIDRYASKAVGAVFMDGDNAYRVTGESLVTNGNFVTGDMAGWINRNLASDVEGESVAYDAEVGGNAVTISTAGAGATNSIGTKWAVTAGNTYYLSFYVGGNKPDSGNYQYNRVFDGSAELVAYGANMTANTWTRFEKVFTAANDTILFQSSWVSNIKFANVELLPVELAPDALVATTIKFVSSNNSTEIKSSVVVNKLPGAVINLADYAPDTITYNNNLYSKDDTNPTSHTVGNSAETVTITYTTDAVTSFEAVTATVIEGNMPILPSTVTGITGKNAHTTLDVEWSIPATLAAGTHTINGTVDGTSVQPTATVTVLSQSFTLDDAESVNGQPGNVIYFPVDIADEFTIEFDYYINAIKNVSVQMGYNGNLFGSAALGISPNNSKLVATGGNGSGTGEGITLVDSVAAGETYRMLLTMDASDDTYTLVLTKSDGTTVTTGEKTFRTAQDAINTMTLLTNGGGAAGDIKISNIKIHSASAEATLTEYTVNVTGTVTDSYTVKAAGVDKVAVPYYEGNIFKSRSVSGTTITYTYVEPVMSETAWAIRNNVSDNTWITEMKYLGSHNAFANHSSPTTNEGGALNGVTGATTPSLAKNMSQTQTLDAVDQLNAGVRFFDIRLTREEDGTFWTYHGPKFSDFRLIAYSISQWAAENPGEVIVFDLQAHVDALYGGSADGHYDIVTGNTNYYGENDGDDNQYYYDALVQLLKETGLWDYMPDNWNQRYGALTNSGEKTVIVPISKGRGSYCVSKFVHRGSYNADTDVLSLGGTSDTYTYTESSSFSTVASHIDSKMETQFGNDARLGTIHAYLTGTNLLTLANNNNTSWIDENLDKWMRAGYGDVLMMNGITQEIGELYVERLSEYNRDYMDDQLGSEFHGETALKSGDVTMTGATGSVPFSTEFVAVASEASGTYTIDGVEYTAHTAYELDLMQFDANSVQPTGEVTVTFPKVSNDTTTVDALLSSDGSTVYWTADLGQAVAIPTAALADVILTTRVAPGKEYTVSYVAEGNIIYTTTEVVPFSQVVYSVPAGDFYLETADKAYILNSATAQSHTAAAEDTTTTFTVDVTIVSGNAVIADAFHNAGDAQPWNNDTNKLFIGSSGVANADDTDADNAATFNGGGNVGQARVPLITFNVPEVAEGKAVKLNLYVAEINGNLGVGGTMKLAANISDIEANETTNAYVAGDIANLEGIVWSDTMVTQGSTETRTGVYNCDQWVSIDVTEFVKNATGDKITFTLYAPTAGAYVVDREKAVVGGAYEGKAAYLEVVDAYTVDVIGASKITRNGNLVNSTDSVVAYEGAQIKLYETSSEIPAFTNGTKVYATDNTTGETAYITVTGADEYYAAKVGIAPVDGAQVRIGDAVDANGKVTANSGLRFITTVDYDNSLAGVTGAEMGVEITAEESSADAVKIVATQFQDDAKTVYTSALTNLAEGNFNRKFTATPYVTADGQTFYGTPVTRSIYQVAAGLLNKDTDGTEYDENYESKRLYDVLNAYVNQTGIRLSLVDNKLIAHDADSTSTKGGKYSGTAFFEVSETTFEGTKYTVTLTPVGENTEIKGYWNEYVRINNNNSSVKVATELVANKDGTYTLTFDTANLG